jgi:hypothetical protein
MNRFLTIAETLQTAPENSKDRNMTIPNPTIIPLTIKLIVLKNGTCRHAYKPQNS